VPARRWCSGAGILLFGGVERAPDDRQRLLEFAHLGVEIAEREQRLEPIRIELDGLLVLPQRVFEIALGGGRRRQQHGGLGRLRILLGCRGRRLARTVGIARLQAVPTLLDHRLHAICHFAAPGTVC
jgi:hypothetical protein